MDPKFTPVFKESEYGEDTLHATVIVAGYSVPGAMLRALRTLSHFMVTAAL